MLPWVGLTKSELKNKTNKKKRKKEKELYKKKTEFFFLMKKKSFLKKPAGLMELARSLFAWSQHRQNILLLDSRNLECQHSCPWFHFRFQLQQSHSLARLIISIGCHSVSFFLLSSRQCCFACHTQPVDPSLTAEPKQSPVVSY